MSSSRDENSSKFKPKRLHFETECTEYNLASELDGDDDFHTPPQSPENVSQCPSAPRQFHLASLRSPLARSPALARRSPYVPCNPVMMSSPGSEFGNYGTTHSPLPLHMEGEDGQLLRSTLDNPFAPTERKRSNISCVRLGPIMKESARSRYMESFEEISVLGMGDFGVVYKCCNRIDGWLYAVKRTKAKLPIHNQQRNTILKEVFAYAAVPATENIVRYYGAWEEDGHLYIQLEYCEGGNLKEYAKKKGILTEAELIVILRQIATGLDNLHDLGMVHLDIKPENIYVSKEVCKIGDFGRLVRHDGDKLSASEEEFEEGDARYMSTEILGHYYQPHPSSDICSLGLTIYELARRQALPCGGGEWKAIREGQIIVDEKEYSSEFRDLILLMVDKDSLRRPSAKQLLEIVHGDCINAELVSCLLHQALEPMESASCTQSAKQSAKRIMSSTKSSTPRKRRRTEVMKDIVQESPSPLQRRVCHNEDDTCASGAARGGQRSKAAKTAPNKGKGSGSNHVPVQKVEKRMTRHACSIAPELPPGRSLSAQFKYLQSR